MTRPTLDDRFMAQALRLAAKGLGATSPNPAVGALVVSRGRIVGQGYHRRAGGPHAEVVAIRQAGARARGATLYVTLEPCSHTHKRTPPCVPLIKESGIHRVVVAMVDPNPQVRGGGIRALRRAGLRVEVGCGQPQAMQLNEAYCHWIRTGQPYVILKAAMTLDGKLATASGESRWITGEAARRHVHQIRSQVDAILVGIGTVLRDNPSLTARRSGGPSRLTAHQPWRVIVDSRLRLPLKARVLTHTHRAKTIIATTDAAPTTKVEQLRARGADVVILPRNKGRVSLAALLTHLGNAQVTSLLIEGGSEVNASAWQSGLVHRVMLYVSPRILGGQNAKSMIGGQAPARLDQARPLHNLSIRPLDHDMLIEGTIRPSLA